MQTPKDQSRSNAHSFRRRLFWFLACTALGLGVGLLGIHFTSDPKWFLALPAALAAGWLSLADPSQCMSRQDCDRE